MLGQDNCKYRIGYFSKNWVSAQKNAYNEDQWVSTNDCVASWFFKVTNVEYAVMAVIESLRSRTLL